MISEADIPVLIICYKRVSTTKSVLQSLEAVQPMNIYIWANAPNPEGSKEEMQKTKMVRQLFENLFWKPQIHKNYQEHHLSAKDSISGAISWFFEKVEHGIILEDDCVVSPRFFSFCKHALEKYKDNERIGQINAHNIQGDKKWGNGDYYFSQYAQIWGWASWRRAWKNCNLNIFNEVSPAQFKEMVQSKFDRMIDRRFWFERYKYTRRANVDTWDAQWGLTLWMNNQICITPNENLVENIGFGHEATNTTENVKGLFDSTLLSDKDPTFGSKHPQNVEVCAEADQVTSERLFKISQAAKWGFIKLRVSSLLSSRLRKKARKLVSFFR